MRSGLTIRLVCKAAGRLRFRAKGYGARRPDRRAESRETYNLKKGAWQMPCPFLHGTENTQITAAYSTWL